MEWIQAHWKDVLAIIGGVVSVCSIIVKLTPTTKDDTILAKIIKLLAIFGIFNLLYSSFSNRVSANG